MQRGRLDLLESVRRQVIVHGHEREQWLSRWATRARAGRKQARADPAAAFSGEALVDRNHLAFARALTHAAPHKADVQRPALGLA